ncbi:MAG TPA: cell division protein CrgA [Actinomycetota bacterium]|nr:cell division protein CrgA [Actinomycetota bacterium]
MPESKSKRKRKGRRVRPTSVQTPPRKRSTPRWVIPTVFGLWGVGVLVIIGNYMRGTAADNRLLFGGLIMIAAGFMFATRIH